jgi:hypothetical protein
MSCPVIVVANPVPTSLTARRHAANAARAEGGREGSGRGCHRQSSSGHLCRLSRLRHDLPSRAFAPRSSRGAARLGYEFHQTTATRVTPAAGSSVARTAAAPGASTTAASSEPTPGGRSGHAAAAASGSRYNGPSIFSSSSLRGIVRRHAIVRPPPHAAPARAIGGAWRVYRRHLLDHVQPEASAIMPAVSGISEHT